MPVTHSSDRDRRAVSVALIHLNAINAARQRRGLPPLEAVDVMREYADLDLPSTRAKEGAAPGTSAR